MRRRLAATGLALCLVSACGSRLPDPVLARIDAAQGAGSSRGAGPTGTTPGEGDPTNPDLLAGPGTTTVGGPAATLAPGQGGPGSGPGGGPGGTTPVVTVPGGGPCKGGATDRGVSDKEIKVATMVTDSGPLPGATAGQFRGTAAYFAMINAKGGICGRKITVVEGDDGLDPQRARAEFTRLEPTVFSFVGSLAVADSGYVDLAKSTGVPYVGVFVDPAGRALPNVLPRSAANRINTAPMVYLKKAHPSATRMGFLYTDVGGVRANVPGTVAAFKHVGYTFAYGPSGTSAASPDYTAEVINLQRNNVNFLLLFAFEINMEVRMARNMRQQNYQPEVKINSIGYHSDLIPLLGDVANGWSNYITYLPVLNEDELATDPALKTFTEWNKRVFPSAQVDLFPVGGWGSAALFVQALEILGPNVTRAGVIDVITNKISTSNGGGLVGTGKPGALLPCFIMVKVVDKKWVRESPAKGFDCTPAEEISF